jgi:hypothetical protein
MNIETSDELPEVFTLNKLLEMHNQNNGDPVVWFDSSQVDIISIHCLIESEAAKRGLIGYQFELVVTPDHQFEGIEMSVINTTLN